MQLREEQLLMCRGATPGPRGAVAGGDNSELYAKDLLQPALDHPPPLDDLHAFLQQPPDAQIPIPADWLECVPAYLRKHFTVASGRLAMVVGAGVGSPLTTGRSDAWTVIAEQTVLMSPLLVLDQSLPADLRIGLVAERHGSADDEGALMALASHGGASLRLDGALRGNDRLQLLAAWEDGAAEHLNEAANDLRKKIAVWTPLYFGDIEYLPCFAAAGTALQFYAITCGHGTATALRAVSPRYNLAYPHDRTRAVMATFKFYQLLRAQRALYPSDVLPAGAVQRAGALGFERELLFRTDQLAVRKRVRPWPAFADWCGADFKQLKKLYEATKQQPGLVHAVGDSPTLQDGVYSVDLIPVGRRSSGVWLDTEDDARLLLHGLLHGLAAIHEAGYVHRDLRWDNFAWTPDSPGSSSSRRWFLIDLETCAPADQPQPVAFQPAGWQSNTLLGGLYTRASDLYQLWLAVQAQCERVVVSSQGRALMDRIRAPPASQELGARQLLADGWLQCQGAGLCRDAGAQPGERGS